MRRKTPYTLLINFRKCPECTSTNISKNNSGMMYCRDCGIRFARQVHTMNPLDRKIVIFSKDGRIYSLDTQEEVVFT